MNSRTKSFEESKNSITNYLLKIEKQFKDISQGVNGKGKHQEIIRNLVFSSRIDYLPNIEKKTYQSVSKNQEEKSLQLIKVYQKEFEPHEYLSKADFIYAFLNAVECLIFKRRDYSYPYKMNRNFKNFQLKTGFSKISKNSFQKILKEILCSYNREFKNRKIHSLIQLKGLGGKKSLNWKYGKSRFVHKDNLISALPGIEETDIRIDSSIVTEFSGSPFKTQKDSYEYNLLLVELLWLYSFIWIDDSFWAKDKEDNEIRFFIFPDDELKNGSSIKRREFFSQISHSLLCHTSFGIESVNEKENYFCCSENLLKRYFDKTSRKTDQHIMNALHWLFEAEHKKDYDKIINYGNALEALFCNDVLLGNTRYKNQCEECGAELPYMAIRKSIIKNGAKILKDRGEDLKKSYNLRCDVVHNSKRDIPPKMVGLAKDLTTKSILKMICMENSE